MFKNYYVFVILMLTMLFCSTIEFNLSPKPNLVLREPRSKFSINKKRSSYFGFTINLRKSSVIVGAPLTMKLKETGEIYKCHISNGTCQSLYFGIPNSLPQPSSILGEIEKEHQFLGFSMDGGPEDDDILVVCAPRLTSNFKDLIYMDGICFWTPNTLGTHDYTKITNLLFVDDQYKNVKDKFRDYPEQGFSVHVTSNKNQIIVGAPGVVKSRGSIVRYLPNGSNSVIPNPHLWNQEQDSMFGFSVGSGYFNKDLPNKIYYVASAPTAKFMSGEVYIFDLVENPSGVNHTIIKHYTFSGSQFGEYFGYAVLAEDFNGDSLTDLIITAPFFSSDGYSEQGAIYVYMNKGNFVFEPKKILKSPIEGKGRFGLSISTLGDVNRDGFIDVAVGAPFAENGTVFIYLGGSEGIRDTYSQQFHIDTIENAQNPYMFGMGLSKGYDFDKNDFNDFAIGAPLAESVFVYKAYPVVKIHTSIKTPSREIAISERNLQIQICYRISMVGTLKVQNQEISLQLMADKTLQRVKLNDMNKFSEMSFNMTATTDEKCQIINSSLTYKAKNIFKAIELELQYGLINGIPNSQEFCDKCAAVDPADPKSITEKIIFNSGCNDVCKVDLSINSSSVIKTFILGSNNTISLTYEITNHGENAYLPQINLTSSNKIKFYSIPPSCKNQLNFLLCDLNKKQLMSTNDKEYITITYDVSQIDGSSIDINASVLCTGREINPLDNVLSHKIKLIEFTEIEANRKTNITTNITALESSSIEIIKNYEIKSKGPSMIKEVEISIEIPIVHKFFTSMETIPIIDLNNITIGCIYNDQVLPLNFNLDSFTLKEHQMENDRTFIFDKTNDIEQLTYDNTHIRAAQENLEKLHKMELSGMVQINRTFVFSCHDPEMVACVKATTKVYDFKPDTSINITLKYYFDSNEAFKVLGDKLESFVIVTKLDISKVGDFERKTVNIIGLLEFIDVSITKPPEYEVIIPWDIVLLSVICGHLLFAIITYYLRKHGFFERKTMEQLERERIIQEKLDALERKKLLQKLLEDCPLNMQREKNI